jgi:hypothetical protein
MKMLPRLAASTVFTRPREPSLLVWRRDRKREPRVAPSKREHEIRTGRMNPHLRSANEQTGRRRETWTRLAELWEYFPVCGVFVTGDSLDTPPPP